MERPRSKARAASAAMTRYGIHSSPFGRYLLAVSSSDEVCALHFLGSGGIAGALASLKGTPYGQHVIRNQAHTQSIASKIFVTTRRSTTIPIVLYGSDFEIKVWDVLSRIPEGEVVTYTEIAQRIKMPKATRAVGTACGKNSIAYLIPCHRVLPRGRGVGGYRWGIERKKALLAWEKSRG